jgi:hypothetical protein
MRIKKDFVLRNVAGADVVLPLGAASVDFNGLLKLNESSVLLWKALEQDTDLDGLVTVLTSEYDVDPATARRDIEAFLARLDQIGCLER